MFRFIAPILATIFLTAPTDASAESLSHAFGKTDMSSENCATRAAKAMEAADFASSSKADVNNFNSTDRNETRTVKGNHPNGALFSIVCRPFKTDLVTFMAYGAKPADDIKEVWASFYK